MSRTHGTPSAYNDGCRCDVCREAHRIRHAKIREGLRARTDVPHGTYSGYINWACRCDACVKANSDHNRAMYDRAGTASKSGPWTEEELALAARQDLTAIQVARQLGRSYGSVTRARGRLIAMGRRES